MITTPTSYLKCVQTIYKENKRNRFTLSKNFHSEILVLKLLLVDITKTDTHQYLNNHSCFPSHTKGIMTVHMDIRIHATVYDQRTLIHEEL